MASHKTARRSRKRHSATKTRPPARGARIETARPPRQRDGAGVAGGRSLAAARTYGERPPGFFGGLPVSELMILVGGIALVVGWLQGGGPAVWVGLGVCFVAVLELTAREHFSGYRSHSTLLAGMAAVAAETAVALLVAPRVRALLLLAVVPVFAAVFVLVRRRFTAARQARVRAIPPAPPA